MRKLKTIEMRRMSPEEYKLSRKMPLTVVLDDVRSAHNVGSVLRSCDAFRVEKVVFCGITPMPPGAEIHKTALGAEDSVNREHSPSAEQAVASLHAAGYVVYAVEQCEGSEPLQLLKTEPEGRYAVVFGNEVKGVHQEVVDLCDGCIEIPQFGTKHSLNVSVAAGIVLWKFAEQLMMTNGKER